MMVSSKGESCQYRGEYCRGREKQTTYLVRVILEDLDDLPPAIVPYGLPASVFLVPAGRCGWIRFEPFFEVLRHTQNQPRKGSQIPARRLKGKELLRCWLTSAVMLTYSDCETT